MMQINLKSGIASKLLGLFSIFALIFYGTILVLYIDVRQMMKISDNIVNKNYKLSSASKKMIENLLNMEESEKKYHLLKKEDYLNYFISAQKEFEKNLHEILGLKKPDLQFSPVWEKLHESYSNFSDRLGDLKGANSSDTLWIPEEVINEWIERIRNARSINELDIEVANRELNSLGRMALNSGLVGLAISTLIGLLGSLFVANSMIRPLRRLHRGIRTISKGRFNESIQISSKDEFGELAEAFNEMALRLEEEERMRSDFISMLSHEIRTPLTSIRESVNMIGEEVMGPINDRQRKFLEIAGSEIGRLCELLNHLMQVSRLESGAIEVQPNPLDPYEFVTRCIYNLNPLAEAKHIGIDLKTQPSLPFVMGDRECLQQVFLNLLGNAIKFSPPKGKICVHVEADESNKELVFTVSDNGPGIPEKELSLIFNKYYRAKGVRDHMDGAGLGLNISRHIIEAHQGTVWVKSVMGTGSTFAFTLPIAKKNERPKQGAGSRPETQRADV